MAAISHKTKIQICENPITGKPRDKLSQLPWMHLQVSAIRRMCVSSGEMKVISRRCLQFSAARRGRPLASQSHPVRAKAQSISPRRLQYGTGLCVKIPYDSSSFMFTAIWIPGYWTLRQRRIRSSATPPRPRGCRERAICKCTGIISLRLQYRGVSSGGDVRFCHWPRYPHAGSHSNHVDLARHDSNMAKIHHR